MLECENERMAVLFGLSRTFWAFVVFGLLYQNKTHVKLIFDGRSDMVCFYYFQVCTYGFNAHVISSHTKQPILTNFNFHNSAYTNLAGPWLHVWMKYFRHKESFGRLFWIRIGQSQFTVKVSILERCILWSGYCAVDLSKV